MNFYDSTNRRIRLSTDKRRVYIYSWRSNREVEHTYRFDGGGGCLAFLEKVFKITVSK